MNDTARADALLAEIPRKGRGRLKVFLGAAPGVGKTFAMLQAAFSLPQRVEDMTLPQALAMVTANPAKAAGLADRGEIAIGKRADLVRVRVIGGLPVVRGVWRQGARVS